MDRRWTLGSRKMNRTTWILSNNQPQIGPEHGFHLKLCNREPAHNSITHVHIACFQEAPELMSVTLMENIPVLQFPASGLYRQSFEPEGEGAFPCGSEDGASQ